MHRILREHTIFGQKIEKSYTPRIGKDILRRYIEINISGGLFVLNTQAKYLTIFVFVIINLPRRCHEAIHDTNLTNI